MMTESFDFSDMEEEFASAGGRDRSVKFIPPTGPAIAEITSAKMRPAKDGTPQLNWSLKLKDGEYAGETIWRNNRIVKGDAKSFNRLNSDLLTAGVKISKLAELDDPATLEKLKGVMVAVSIKVTDASKGFYDVYLNRRVTEVEGEAAF